MDTDHSKHKALWVRAPGCFPQALNNLLDDGPALQIRQQGMIFQGFGTQHVKVETDPTLLIPQAPKQKAAALNEDLISEILA